MRTSVKVAGGLLAALAVVGHFSAEDADRLTAPGTGGDVPSAASPGVAPGGELVPERVPEVTAPPSSEPVAPPAVAAPAATRAARPAAAGAVLLRAAAGGDGDSWKDTAGREYRLGLVNTPETNECFGSRATTERRDLVAGGFRAQVYSTDSYGRGVAVVTLADGRNLNVFLARHGYADDRYLEQFRSENPGLARQLDAAFAAARAEKAGLWGACSSAPAPAAPRPQPVAAQPQSGSCHPSYKTCVPVKGDGSGAGQANDLDCGEIGKVVYLRQVGDDPYRLDSNGDGVGCESFG